MSFHTGEQSSLSFPNYANESLNKGDNADAGQSIICHVERSETSRKCLMRRPSAGSFAQAQDDKNLWINIYIISYYYFIKAMRPHVV